MRHFNPSAIGSGDILVSRVMAQVSAGQFGCRWRAASIPGLYIYGLLHFLLCQLDSRVRTSSMDTEGPVVRQWSPTHVGLSRFVCSLNLG